LVLFDACSAVLPRHVKRCGRALGGRTGGLSEERTRDDHEWRRPSRAPRFVGAGAIRQLLVEQVPNDARRSQELGDRPAVGPNSWLILALCPTFSSLGEARSSRPARCRPLGQRRPQSTKRLGTQLLQAGSLGRHRLSVRPLRPNRWTGAQSRHWSVRAYERRGWSEWHLSSWQA